MNAVQAFALSARKRGADCLVNGRVEDVRMDAGSLEGSVRESLVHRVVWRHQSGAWSNECACRPSGNCHHAYAVAQYALQHGTLHEAGEVDADEGEGSMDEKIDRLLNLVSGSPKAHAQHRETRVKPLITRILESRNAWDALQLIPAFLSQLGLKTQAPHDSWLSFLKTENRGKRAWLFARELLKHGVPLPVELEAFRHNEDFDREEVLEREEELASSIEEWVDGLAWKEPKPDRSIRIVWSWDPAAPKGSGPRIGFLMTSKKLKDASRSFQQVCQFASEAIRDEHLFGQGDADFLFWLDSASERLAPVHRDALEIEMRGNALKAWLTVWGRTQRCVWADGSAVRYEDEPARIEPEIVNAAAQEQEGGQPCLDLVVQFPGGERILLSQAQMILPQEGKGGGDEPIFVCRQGVFHPVLHAPPIAVLKLFLDGVRLPLMEGQRARMIAGLLRRFPGLAESSRGLIRYHAVQPSFSFALQADDWLCVRLFATSREDGRKWEFTSHGWTQSGRLGVDRDLKPLSLTEDAGEPVQPQAKHPVDELEVLPDPRETHAAQQWFEGLDYEEAEDAGLEEGKGWVTHLTSRGIDFFLEQWAMRPPKADYWANPSFRALITPSRKSLPRLKVRSSGMDWFSLSTEWATMARQLTAADMENLTASTEKFIKLSSGQWASKEQAGQIKAVLDVMSDLGLDASLDSPQRLTVWQLTGASRESIQKLSTLFETEGDDETIAALEDLRKRVTGFKSLPEIAIPNRLRADMRAYQVEGLKFLTYCSSLRLGAILADDMGLGKTLQALAWMEHLRDTEGPSPCLVICPASVVYNWQREAEKFVSKASVLLLTSGEARHSLRREIPKHDLIVTNYALLRRDLDELRQFEFRAVVLDEAQNIKNPDSLVARAAKQLRATHRLALTGTPLENRLLDLWSIADFATPGYLGTRTRFTEMYDVPDKPHQRRQLASRLRPMLLRRIKREVAPDLPDRIEERLDCELTKGQGQLYLAELQRARKVVSDLQAEESFPQKKLHVLAALTRLRQICCHPTLVGGSPELGSGKTAALMELVEPLIAEGHKVLVFSQFVGMLKLLEGELTTSAIPYHMLTGRTARREEVVEAFQNDKRASVFLLSLRAAGTGLNLTAASYVVLYDPWWNPAVEAQAIDRTHRIGQDRTVITYRLVAKNTVEDKIFQLQQKKAAVVKDILGEEGFARNLTKDDLQFLFSD